MARACGTRWTYNWALEAGQLPGEGQFNGPSELMRRIVELKRTPE